MYFIEFDKLRGIGALSSIDGIEQLKTDRANLRPPQHRMHKRLEHSVHNTSKIKREKKWGRGEREICKKGRKDNRGNKRLT